MTRLLVLAYHRARAGVRGNDPAVLDAHFAHVARHHRCVLPGEPLDPGRINVCLSFDDATFDFYAVVFPLLRKHGLRALLAVTPGFVRERCDLPAELRLAAPADGSLPPSSRGGFCTWPELRELVASGRVAVAAHGYTHCRLDRPDSDLMAEVLVPQSLLAGRLGGPISSFVFPYGRFSPAALAAVRENYRYAFRLGGADNSSWRQRLLYRVDGDRLPSPEAPFRRPALARARTRAWWNRLRRR